MLALAACLQTGSFCRGYHGRFISHPVAIFLPGPHGHLCLGLNDHLANSPHAAHPVQVLEGDMSPLVQLGGAAGGSVEPGADDNGQLSNWGPSRLSFLPFIVSSSCSSSWPAPPG